MEKKVNTTARASPRLALFQWRLTVATMLVHPKRGVLTGEPCGGGGPLRARNAVRGVIGITEIEG